MTKYLDVQFNYFIDDDGNVVITKLLVENMTFTGVLLQTFERTGFHFL